MAEKLFRPKACTRANHVTLSHPYLRRFMFRIMMGMGTRDEVLDIGQWLKTWTVFLDDKVWRTRCLAICRAPPHRTLESNAALAAMVQELMLGTQLSVQASTETADHRRIIAAGYAEAEKYRETIAGPGDTGCERGQWAVHISTAVGHDAFLRTCSSLSRLRFGFQSTSEAEEGAALCPTLKTASKHISFASFAALVPVVSILSVQPGPQRMMPATACASGGNRWKHSVCLLIPNVHISLPSSLFSRPRSEFTHKAYEYMNSTDPPPPPALPRPPPLRHDLASPPGAGALTALTRLPGAVPRPCGVTQLPRCAIEFKESAMKNVPGIGGQTVGFTGTAERAIRGGKTISCPWTPAACVNVERSETIRPTCANVNFLLGNATCSSTVVEQCPAFHALGSLESESGGIALLLALR
ncbi:hypothetical protein DFH07DRAFT_772825 [Mycena maculata]|uniref:Uncharacterized protein n=1 Tax=Mycena maculata TaxID=230809 RepID=A0AAD7J7G9_9AGAR|nr:hypothetical protein DFH07DRAFT_772825 [Mycena maculata]